MKATGSLTASAQVSLGAFCSGSAGAALDVGILGSLKGCAEGSLASSMDAASAAALSAWLSDSSCPLSSELRGTVIAWMSFGASASAGYKFDSTAIAQIEGAMAASTDMSATLKGALGVAISGGSAGSVSIAGCAEMSAFLCGSEGASFGGS